MIEVPGLHARQTSIVNSKDILAFSPALEARQYGLGFGENLKHAQPLIGKL